MKQEFQSIKILHFALVGGALLMALVIYFILGVNESKNPDTLWEYVLPGLLILGLLGAFVMNKEAKNHLEKEANLAQKLANYRKRVIMRSALLEGVILNSLVFTYIAENPTLVIYPAIAWLALLFVRPRMAEFVKDYNISGQEEQEMQH